MLQCLLQLPQLKVLNTGKVVVFAQVALKLLVLTFLVSCFSLLFDTDCVGEVIERSLIVTHVIVAFASQEEGLCHLRVLVAGIC